MSDIFRRQYIYETIIKLAGFFGQYSLPTIANTAQKPSRPDIFFFKEKKIELI